MKLRLLKNLLPLSILAVIGFSISSCQKIAGHTVVPSGNTTTTTTTTTGSATFGLATGTVTFTIDKVGTYTWSASTTYVIGFGTTPTTGTFAFASTPATLITATPSDVNQALTNSFTICFSGTTPGTYPLLNYGSGIMINGVAYHAAGGTEMATVTSESITITSTDYGTVKGTAKGTFTGQMTNLTNAAPVNIFGTFDVAMQ